MTSADAWNGYQVGDKTSITAVAEGVEPEHIDSCEVSINGAVVAQIHSARRLDIACHDLFDGNDVHS